MKLGSLLAGRAARAGVDRRLGWCRVDGEAAGRGGVVGDQEQDGSDREGVRTVGERRGGVRGGVRAGFEGARHRRCTRTLVPRVLEKVKVGVGSLMVLPSAGPGRRSSYRGGPPGRSRGAEGSAKRRPAAHLAVFFRAKLWSGPSTTPHPSPRAYSHIARKAPPSGARRSQQNRVASRRSRRGPLSPAACRRSAPSRPRGCRRDRSGWRGSGWCRPRAGRPRRPCPGRSRRWTRRRPGPSRSSR